MCQFFPLHPRSNLFTPYPFWFYLNCSVLIRTVCTLCFKILCQEKLNSATCINNDNANLYESSYFQNLFCLSLVMGMGKQLHRHQTLSFHCQKSYPVTSLAFKILAGIKHTFQVYTCSHKGLKYAFKKRRKLTLSESRILFPEFSVLPRTCSIGTDLVQ